MLSLSRYINKSFNIKEQKKADSLFNAICEASSTSPSSMCTTLGHHGPSEHTLRPVTAPSQINVTDCISTMFRHPVPIASPAQVNKTDSPTVNNINLDNCEELIESDVNNYLKIKGSRERPGGNLFEWGRQCR